MLEKYTFDTYVSGDCNKYALLLARLAVESPGMYNPLVIYGDSGLGKTHLLNAIYNYVREHDPSKRIHLLSCNEFVDIFFDALYENLTEQWTEYWIDTDFLLIDDIHILERKNATQSNIMSLLLLLAERHCQIVMTSSIPPENLTVLHDTFVHEIEGSIYADIGPLDAETRKMIVIRKASEFGIRLSKESADFVSELGFKNVRAIEGVLSKLRAQTELMGSAADLKAVIESCCIGNPNAYK